MREAFLIRQRSIVEPGLQINPRDPVLMLGFSKAAGTASPSVAATLIERLPDEGDPRRAEEETIAKNVAAIAYGGMLF